MTQIQKIEARLHAITWQAQGIHTFEFRPQPGHSFPAFTAGAHIDLYLTNGLVRSYSLCNAQGETHRYVVGINKDASSRGGSKHVHESLRVGDILTISAPRNNFELDEKAPHTALIAGGIGVTPLYCMMQRLTEIGASWEVIYSARTHDLMAFRDEIDALAKKAGRKALFNFDHEPGGKMLDLKDVVSKIPADAHLYCCGPNPMLKAFESACAGRKEETVHVEYFTAEQPAATEGGYNVVLKRSGKTVFVPEGKTILDAMLDAGMDVPFSCMEGVCGTCETKVLSGTPDHRDLILTESERQANNTMMICCSGSKTPELVLDL
jgi:vanillate O-demethylase ferredoxin subunit